MLALYDLGFSGLADYTGGVATDCKPGWDYLCGKKGGIYSCRPCNTAQLAAFKELQNLANRLVVAFALDDRAAVVTGPQTCTGGYKLAIDGRVGPCTRRTVAAIVNGKGQSMLTPLSSALEKGTFKNSEEYVAQYVPELLAYFRELAKIASAPEVVAAPPSQPISTVTAPGSVPKPIALPKTTVVPVRVERKGLKYAILGLAAVSAIGLVGAGVYYFRSERGY